MDIPVKTEITQILFLLIVFAFAIACGKKNVKRDVATDTAQTVFDAALIVENKTGSETEGSLRDKKYVPETGIRTVYFDFDSSELNDDVRKTLQENAAALKKRAGFEIQVAGHCDERGTTEYNLALGQRRANVVRNYYKALGVAAGRMSTISYGEESPVCPESTEDCRARNRRAETLMKAE